MRETYGGTPLVDASRLESTSKDSLDAIHIYRDRWMNNEKENNEVV